MIQAFVSLRLHQPPRTESGMRSFFEALQGAVFSQPTIFRTNADASARAYTLDDVVEAALNPNCKFVVLRAEREKFWQCTFLLPDKQGMGALFFDLQRSENGRRLSPESLIEMFKKLYGVLSPRIIRIGDSEAREKLKSRHGLVLMPGLGRIEWLQIIAPEVYNEIYNPSDLIAAPGYATEIWDDGALFLRVYDDPNDWESEDNISQANFVPGFLAGIVKIKDNEREKENLRDLEKLWARAEKTAEKAYRVLDEEKAEKRQEAQEAVEEIPITVDSVVEERSSVEGASSVEGKDLEMRTAVYDRLRSDYKVDEQNIVKVGVEGPCTIFKVKTNDKKPPFFVSYQDLELKVFLLNSMEDLSRFISANGCSVQQKDVEKIRGFLKTYYHPDYVLLDSLDDLPANVRHDRRIPDIEKDFKPSVVTVDNGIRSIVFWFYRPDIMGIETLKMTQYEEWPVQLEVKIQCTEMENEEGAPAAAVENKSTAITAERKATTQEIRKSAGQGEQAVKTTDQGTPKTAAAVAAEPAAPKIRSTSAEAAGVELKPVAADHSTSKVWVSVLLILALVYFVLVFGLCDGDWSLSPILEQLRQSING